MIEVILIKRGFQRILILGCVTRFIQEQILDIQKLLEKIEINPLPHDLLSWGFFYAQVFIRFCTALPQIAKSRFKNKIIFPIPKTNYRQVQG